MRRERTSRTGTSIVVGVVDVEGAEGTVSKGEAEEGSTAAAVAAQGAGAIRPGGVGMATPSQLDLRSMA